METIRQEIGRALKRLVAERYGETGAHRPLGTAEPDLRLAIIGRASGRTMLQ